jgi:hypothetical protein
MTSKTLSGYYQDGYTISAAVTSLSISAGAYIGSSGGDPPTAGISDAGDRYALTLTNSGGTVTGTIYGVALSQNVDFVNTYGLIRYLDRPAKAVGGYITGGTDGVELSASGTVTNYDTIHGGVTGVDLGSSGEVINESTGIIRGGSYAGVSVAGASTVENYGTIESQADGIVSTSRVVNGSAADTSALVTSSGNAGVRISSDAASLTNFGTIVDSTLSPTLSIWGVIALNDATVTNGSASDPTAAIKGGLWLDNISGSAALGRNLGLIEGYNEEALDMSYGSFINGEAHHTFGTIEGVNGGVGLGNDATLTNFGEIEGLDGTSAVDLGTTDRLNMESGSTIIGYVSNYHGTIDVVGGVCALASLGSSGTIEGRGTLGLTGVATFFNSAELLVDEVAVSGAATQVKVNADISDARVWDQTGGVVTVEAGDQLTFSGAGDSFSGTFTGGGTVDLSAGRDTLSDLTISTASIAVGKADVTLTGAIALETVMSAPVLIIAAAGATLSGGGTLTLADDATSKIVGAAAGARLANDDTIRAAGRLGNGLLTLANGVPGLIDDPFKTELVINAGTANVINAGTVECDGTGGLIIDGGVSNSGVLEAARGTLTVEGAVSGVGLVRIAGGQATFDSTCDQEVAFTAAGGLLELVKSQSDAITVSGFSKTGASSLDLRDIKFGADTKATYSGTTTSGVLTVTDGTHTARITLDGNYRTSAFTVSSDGNGGTTVIDPTARVASPPTLPPGLTVPPLITAIAGFGAGAVAASAIHAPETWRPPPNAIAPPGIASA